VGQTPINGWNEGTGTIVSSLSSGSTDGSLDAE